MLSMGHASARDKRKANFSRTCAMARVVRLGRSLETRIAHNGHHGGGMAQFGRRRHCTGTARTRVWQHLTIHPSRPCPYLRHRAAPCLRINVPFRPPPSKRPAHHHVRATSWAAMAGGTCVRNAPKAGKGKAILPLGDHSLRPQGYAAMTTCLAIPEKCGTLFSCAFCQTIR